MNRFLSVLAFSSALLLAPESTPTCEAGAEQGPRRWTVRVQAHDEVVHYIRFVGHQTAEFAILGDTDTDVDIFVYDEAGHLVASDIGLSDLGMVRWVPSRTQTFRIVVRNLGAIWNAVHMGHN